MTWRRRLFSQFWEDELLQARLRKAYRRARYAGSERRNNTLAVDQSMPGWEADARLLQDLRVILEMRPFS